MTNTNKQLNRIFGSRRRAISRPLAVSTMLFSTVTALWSQDTATYSYSVLYTFGGQPDGNEPNSGLVRDKEGNLYGTTLWGGNSNCQPGAAGCGTVFKINPNNKETILYNFTGRTDGGANGYSSNLIRDEVGNLYGTSGTAGDLSNCSGCGAVYRIDPVGHYTNLYSFKGGSDGNMCGFQITLLRYKAGNLYGTTLCGGSDGYGVVFKLAPPQSAGSPWTETVLHSFSGSDGQQPQAGLIGDGEGNLYGTTVFGGSASSGVVFKLDRSGKETVLHSFTGGADGYDPLTSVVRDKQGNLYGVNSLPPYWGSVYKLDPAGNLTVIYSFTGGTDGQYPSAVIRDPAGNLYGTAIFGGDPVCGCGVVFKIDPAGNQTVLHTFLGSTDGSYPEWTLTLDQAGNLYGTASNGGDLGASACFGFGCGVVFKLTRSGGSYPQ